MKQLFVYAVLLVALGVPTLANADAKADAEAAYATGTAHFQAGRHADALAAFDQAYKLDPAPVLLYNIARCHEEMGDVEQARTNFRLYLKRVPDAPDRADVERRIRVMEAVAARARPAPPPPVRTTVTPKPADPPYLAYSLAGAGAAGLITGIVLGSRAASLDDDYSAEVLNAQRKQSLGDDAESAATWANVAYGVGGALLVGGVVLWLIDEPSAPVTGFVTPQGVGLHGRF